jgi:hypothetical protein
MESLLAVSEFNRVELLRERGGTFTGNRWSYLGADRKEVSAMKPESRLTMLQSRYRVLLGSALVAKAEYIAVKGERSVTPATVARMVTYWQELESRKHAVAEQIRQLELPEHDVIA